MKTQNRILLQPISKKEFTNMAHITPETLDVVKKHASNFTIAELYNIQKQRRTFHTRRQLVR